MRKSRKSDYAFAWEHEAASCSTPEQKERLFLKPTPLELELIYALGDFSDFHAEQLADIFSKDDKGKGPRFSVELEISASVQNLLEGIVALMVHGNTTAGWMLHRSIYESLIFLNYVLSDSSEESALEVLLETRVRHRENLERQIRYVKRHKDNPNLYAGSNLRELVAELEQAEEAIRHFKTHYPDGTFANELPSPARCAEIIDERELEQGDASGPGIGWHYLQHFGYMSFGVHRLPGIFNPVIEFADTATHVYFSGNPRERIALGELTLNGTIGCCGIFLSEFFPKRLKALEKQMPDLGNMVEREKAEQEKYLKRRYDFIWPTRG